MPIRVLICDDSAVMRALLADIVGRQPDMEVVGTAADAGAAQRLIRSLDPDVLTLDVAMPGMDGLEFLARLMRLRPMPVVMISNLAAHGSEVCAQAMALGAVEVLAKPRIHTTEALSEYGKGLVERVRGAYERRRGGAPQAPLGAAMPAAPRPGPRGGRRCVFIGASTGGTEAIKSVLTALPSAMPPILMVQHMPEMFTGSFARRLDGLCALHVKEAEDGEPALPGTVYLAPGHSHLSVRRDGAGYRCVLTNAAPVNRHRPSVDVLFHSAAEQAGAAALGVLLTGMGKDGAQGLLAMRAAGAWTIAQDQASCVVYGMPREAAAIGAACEVVGLHEVADHLLRRLGPVATGAE